MYAAAGGASLASRQARQRQRLENTKNKALLQQAKLDKIKASGIVTAARTQQSRQFHQLPATYLRTPQAQARKLSAQSKLLLPISEQQQQQQHMQPCTQNAQQRENQAQHDLHHPRPASPKLCRFERYQQQQNQLQQQQLHQQQLHEQHELKQQQQQQQQQFQHQHHHHHPHHHLTKSATATLPLNSHTESTPPATPLISISQSKPPLVGFGYSNESKPNDPNQKFCIPIPHDSIIVTPATPQASPGHAVHSANGQQQDQLLDDIPSGQLERKCSFYRVRRSDAFEHEGNYTPTTPGGTILQGQQLDPYTDDNLIYGGLPNGGSGQKWSEAAYCEQGICACEHFECAQGRAAWLERGRRCSVQDNNPASCHRRWVKRNRIQDSSLGGSSDDEDLLGVLRGPSSFANAFLYVGLGTIAIGLVISFVGTGEKGFKTVELRLIGPSLIGIGLICCILRICFCICPSHCISSSRKARKKNSNKIDADHTTSLLRGESKRVSIAKGPHIQKFPLTHKSKSNNKMVNEGMEALRQIATTSLFLQNEQKASTNRVVPIIKEPEASTEAPLEMKKLETTLNICDISDDDDEEDEVGLSSYHNQTESLVHSQGKLARQRLPTNQSKRRDSDIALMETSLMIINPTPPVSASTSSAIVKETIISSPPSRKPHHHLLEPQSSSSIPSSSSHAFEMPPPSPAPSTATTSATTSSHRYLETTGAGQFFSSQKLQLPIQVTQSLTAGTSSSSSSFTPGIHGPGGSHHQTTSTSTTNTSSTLLPIQTQSQQQQQQQQQQKQHHHYPSPATTIVEPELVLSPAKLGQ